MRIFWTETALNQLEDIFDFYLVIADSNTTRKIVSAIVDKTIILEKTPHIGQSEELLVKREKEYRYLVEGNYKIIYWIEETEIKIASVFDCRQNPTKMQNI